MASATDYLEDKLRRLIFLGTAWAVPGTLYVALYTTAPTEAGTGGVEVSGGGYARMAVASTGANWAVGTGSDGSVSNINAITSPVATTDWGTIVAVALLDAANGGNMLFTDLLVAPVTIVTGQAFSFTPGMLSHAFD